MATCPESCVSTINWLIALLVLTWGGIIVYCVQKRYKEKYSRSAKIKNIENDWTNHVNERNGVNDVLTERTINEKRLQDLPIGNSTLDVSVHVSGDDSLTVDDKQRLQDLDQK
jgi:hypothetical protein